MTLQEAMELARVLKQSRSVLPKDITTEGDIVGIILAGQELGLGPMASLRGIRIVLGKVELSADLKLGIMGRSGIKAKWVEKSADAARLQLQVDGQEPETFSFTAEDARKAELNSPMWKKYTAAMLRARAVSVAGRGFAPAAAVLHGTYDPGEISGEPPTASAPVAELVSEGDPEMAERIAEANGVRDEQKALIEAWDEDLATVAKDADSLLQWVHFNAAEIDGLDHRVKGRFLTVVKGHGERVGFAISTKRKDVDLESGQNYRRLKQAIADGCNDEGPPPTPEPPTAQEEAQALIEDVFAESLGER